MQIKWFRKKSETETNTITALFQKDSITDKKSVPPSIGEDAAQTIVRARNMNSWLDQAVKDCQESGGFDHLEGKGKPIEVPDGDPLNSMLKNANVLPPWLELQHDIRNRILKLIERMDLGQVAIEDELTAINKLIVRYNQSVPTPILQKGRLAVDRIREQAELWK